LVCFFIILVIFFLAGAVVIWKINKKLFQIIAKNPEKLMRWIFGFTLKLGIKTAPLKSHWKSIIGEKIVDLGIVQKRPYGKKYFIETRAFLCENQGEKQKCESRDSSLTHFLVPILISYRI